MQKTLRRKPSTHPTHPTKPKAGSEQKCPGIRHPTASEKPAEVPGIPLAVESTPIPLLLSVGLLSPTSRARGSSQAPLSHTGSFLRWEHDIIQHNCAACGVAAKEPSGSSLQATLLQRLLLDLSPRGELRLVRLSRDKHQGPSCSCECVSCPGLTWGRDQSQGGRTRHGGAAQTPAILPLRRKQTPTTPAFPT